MWRKYRALWSPDGPGSAAPAAVTAADPNGSAAPAGVTGGQGGPASVWHQGIDPDTIGFWQNKGYKVDDPKELASELTKQYRNLEKHLGVPPDQLLKLPKPDAKPEEIKEFRMKLGMPAEPKEYDFSTVKTADGQPISPALADALRSSAYEAGLSKDAAAKMAAATVKHLDDTRAAEATSREAKIAEEQAALFKQWGDKRDYNHLKAMEGVARLGITPEAVKALESQIGYAAVMEAMRKIGAGTSEDTFVDHGARGGPGTPVTRDGAISRLNELQKDAGWGARLTAGDVAAKQEMQALLTLIDGESAAA